MRNIVLTFLLLSFTSCSTTPQIENSSITKNVDSQVVNLPLQTPTINTEKTPNSPNENVIDALVNAPKLVHYGEDGAHDSSVLALYMKDADEASPPVKEVRDIVAMKNKAIPLLIECLDDTRDTSATFTNRFSSSGQHFKVPVGHICLDILLNITNNPDIYDKECPRGEAELGGCIKDGYYFRPDDYAPIGWERPIVRIVKANWLKSYRNGKVKYDYVVIWK